VENCTLARDEIRFLRQSVTSYNTCYYAISSLLAASLYMQACCTVVTHSSSNIITNNYYNYDNEDISEEVTKDSFHSA